jgi:hypothetical protein
VLVVIFVDEYSIVEFFGRLTASFLTLGGRVGAMGIMYCVR